MVRTLLVLSLIHRFARHSPTDSPTVSPTLAPTTSPTVGPYGIIDSVQSCESASLNTISTEEECRNAYENDFEMKSSFTFVDNDPLGKFLRSGDLRSCTPNSLLRSSQ